MKRKVLASVVSLIFFIVLVGCKKDGDAVVTPPPLPQPGASLTKRVNEGVALQPTTQTHLTVFKLYQPEN